MRLLSNGHREEAVSAPTTIAAPPDRRRAERRRPGPGLDPQQRALATRMITLMRGPLSHASGVIDSLLSGSAGPLPTSVDAHLGSLAYDTSRLDKAVEDLDALVRMGTEYPGEMGLLVADDWLGRAIAVHEERARRRGVHLRLDAPEPGLLVRGVPEDLDRALHQLLDNAVSASLDGGTVAVEAVADGARLLVRVSDSGIGFDPEEGDGLTDCFVRSTAAEAHGLSGLGIGLFLADRIAREHGGRVELHGELGRGATVWLDLPQG